MTVRIKISPRGFGRAWKKLQGRIEDSMVEAMHEAAEYGRTKVQSTIKQTSPQPVATGTYRNSWKVDRLKKGAVLGNTTLQSYFVEMGRNPGKPPPVDAIEAWLKVKRARQRGRRGLAFAIARKIGKEGTEARYPLGRTVPHIKKFLQHEIRSKVKSTRPPRG